MANAPPGKPWGIADKNYLQKQIEKGTVDITKSANVAYIDQVRFDHFHHRNSHNSHHNFRSYARLQELKGHLSGYP
jgi:hypothetical protein